MTSKLTFYILVAGLLISAGYFVWKMTSRSAYETAPYNVVKSDGPFELREYPSLTMATTDMEPDYEGRDGSFMQLFKYISGENAREQKIPMTTPVFMEQNAGGSPRTMGFVLPQKLSEKDTPQPSSGAVKIEQRDAGLYATIRFSGRINPELVNKKMNELKSWMQNQGMTAIGQPEVAGYDAPWTPGAFRRNEILIPVKQ